MEKREDIGDFCWLLMTDFGAQGKGFRRQEMGSEKGIKCMVWREKII